MRRQPSQPPHEHPRITAHGCRLGLAGLSGLILALSTGPAGRGGGRGGRGAGRPLIREVTGSPRALSAVRMAAQRTLASAAGVEFQLEGSTALGSSTAPVLGSGEFDFPSSTGSETIDLG